MKTMDEESESSDPDDREERSESSDEHSDDHSDEHSADPSDDSIATGEDLESNDWLLVHLDKLSNRLQELIDHSADAKARRNCNEKFEECQKKFELLSKGFVKTVKCILEFILSSRILNSFELDQILLLLVGLISKRLLFTTARLPRRSILGRRG